jgi:DNA-binding response OmpR family regulator
MGRGGDRKSSVILVVDDDESVLSFLAFSLAQEGFDVIRARDGETAVKILNHTTPDLLLLDVMLPNMDGFSLCQKVRQDKKFSHVPILFITAYAEEQKLTAQKAHDVGAQGFIEKPIMFDELLLQLMEALAGRDSLPTRFKYAA